MGDSCIFAEASMDFLSLDEPRPVDHDGQGDHDLGQDRAIADRGQGYDPRGHHDQPAKARERENHAR